jgi:integrase
VITRIELDRKKPGSTYDPKAKTYITYRIDLRIRGKRIRTAGFPSRKDAEKHVELLKANARNQRHGVAAVSKITVKQLLDKRLAKLAKRPEKVRGRRVFDMFLEITGNIPIQEVRRSHFQKFINSRADKSNDTVIREVAMLSVAFRTASEMFPELDDYQPPKVPRPKRDRRKKTKHVITETEMRAIVGNLQQSKYAIKVGRMFALAWFLGLRYGEIVRLKKSDFKGSSLRVYRPKTDDITVFEGLPDEVRQLLADAIADADGEAIFSDKQIHPNSFYLTLKAAVAKAGLEYGRSAPGSISFHSTRHSFVTRMMQVADMATTQSLSGHSTATMIAHYSHSTPETRKTALRKLYGGADLKEIYEQVRSGTMTFDAFKMAVEK